MYIYGTEIEQMEILNREMQKNIRQEKYFKGLIKRGRLQQIRKSYKKISEGKANSGVPLEKSCLQE